MFSRGKKAFPGDHRSNTSRHTKPPSRKERRKQERVAKKQRRANQYQKNGDPPQPSPKLTVLKDTKPVKNLKPPSKDESSLARLYRKRALEIANKREDAEISKLEKLLKIKRRKKLPSSFRDEGLGYILDLTDKSGQFDWGTLSSDSEQEQSGTHNNDSEPEELSLPHKKQKSTSSKETEPSATKSNKNVRFALPDEANTEGSEFNEETDEGSEFDSDGYVESGDEGNNDWFEESDVELSDFSGDCDVGDGGGENSDACDSGEGSDAGDSGDENRDAGGGSDACDSGGTGEGSGGKYIPPHMRLKIHSGDERRTEKLQKQVQGLINRLSESNLRSITTQLEQLYREKSRNDMSSVLCAVLLKLCAAAVRLTDRFAMEHAMLVAILHSNVGQEVGAFVVQKLAQRLDALLQDSPHTHSTKECSCVLMIIAFLYNYRVIYCGLIYDIIRQLLEALSERNIELLLILLKHTGMEIRRDDASSLKDIILLIQQKANSSGSQLAQSSRVKFMLETISALKTNNARKIPNYDPSLLEHMKKLLRGLVRSSGSLDEGQLKISFKDLLKADTHGRWWIVGSAWSGQDHTPHEAPLPRLNTEGWVLELARKQRMTTDVRKTVFSVIMTSEDYADAFERLTKLGLKEVQEREVIRVLVDCCLQERTYNPYYAFLGQKLCEFKHSHQVTFQYSVWDRFKVLETLTKPNRANLVKLLSHLISTRALSIAVLRVVEFVELGPSGIKFYKSLLTSLLCDHPQDTVVTIFARVTPLDHLKAFRDKLLVFMKHYLVNERSSELLEKRLEMVEKMMKTDSNLF